MCIVYRRFKSDPDNRPANQAVPRFVIATLLWDGECIPAKRGDKHVVTKLARWKVAGLTPYHFPYYETTLCVRAVGWCGMLRQLTGLNVSVNCRCSANVFISSTAVRLTMFSISSSTVHRTETQLPIRSVVSQNSWCRTEIMASSLPTTTTSGWNHGLCSKHTDGFEIWRLTLVSTATASEQVQEACHKFREILFRL